MTMVETDDGLRLSYDDQGHGPAVILLAGLTRNRADFGFLAPYLERYRVIGLDARGRGASEPDPMRGYTIAREAQDVIALLDHLALERVTVIGTSRGGLVAMMLAALQPERLCGVVLNDIGPVIAAPGLARIMDYVGQRPPWGTLDEAALALADAHKDAFPDVPLERWHQQARAQFAEGVTGLELRYDPALRDALLEQAAAHPAPHDLWPLYDALATLPLAVIRGANSDILAPETLAEMRVRKPDLICAEVPNRGHVPFLDEAPSLAAIRQLLEYAA